MDGLASALMLLALICSDLAQTRERADGASPEWMLVATLFAATALLVWLPLHGTKAALLLWLAHTTAGGNLLMAQHVPRTFGLMRLPAWTLGTLALLGVAPGWHL